jgi:hypothetical protein
VEISVDLLVFFWTLIGAAVSGYALIFWRRRYLSNVVPFVYVGTSHLIDVATSDRQFDLFAPLLLGAMLLIVGHCMKLIWEKSNTKMNSTPKKSRRLK